ncbi:site-specific integrase [Candidatus Nomurabacteria bacterium]|nr:site-specific integrase [Candidatus Nomurabacteria bacterium]MCB9826659.1 site-specific integrase [Candidatus Nomurabacteria bacterium]
MENLPMAHLLDTGSLRQKASLVFDGVDVSSTTRAEYKYRIGMFIDFITTHGLNANTYLEYKRYLATRSDYTIATKNKYLATAKVFLRELNRTGVIPVDITHNTKLFKQIKKHKKDGLSAKEVVRVAEYIRELPMTPYTARLKALFSLLALQGLRQIEVIRLDKSHIDFVTGVAHVTSKGSDDTELVHLSPVTLKALQAHIKLNRVGSGALFRSIGNRRSERLSTMTIKREFQSIFDALEIGKSVHGFRHFYITQLLSQFDVRDARKFSRHKSLEMLIVYDDEIDVRQKADEVAKLFNDFNVS